MTKDEKLKRIEDIEKELAELKESIKEEDENNQLWMPKCEEKYCYINTYGETVFIRWINHFTDRKRLAIGNVFKTKEEADFAIEKLKVIHELKQFAIPKGRLSKDKSCPLTIGLDSDTQNLRIIRQGCVRYGEIYFLTLEMAEKAIEAVGKERIKKYYLEVE